MENLVQAKTPIQTLIQFVREEKNSRRAPSQLAEQLNIAEDSLDELLQTWFGGASESAIHFIRQTNFFVSSQNQSADLFTENISEPVDRTMIPNITIHLKKWNTTHPTGSEVKIRFDVLDSVLGSVLIASNHEGLCLCEFMDSLPNDAHTYLSKIYPEASIENGPTTHGADIVKIIAGEVPEKKSYTLSIAGSDFQFKVWKTLLTIPSGHVQTYLQIATGLNMPDAARAVGTAIGNNPIALLIPCHRVLRSDGGLGGYRWGLERKIALLGRERAKKLAHDIE